jgi:hypothetical protein
MEDHTCIIEVLVAYNKELQAAYYGYEFFVDVNIISVICW